MSEDLKITCEPKDTESCSFVLDRPVYEGGSAYFGDQDRASGSPLPEKLFALDGVKTVLVQDNKVTITAEGIGDDWLPLAKQVGATIRSVLQSGGETHLRLPAQLHACVRADQEDDRRALHSGDQPLHCRAWRFRGGARREGERGLYSSWRWVPRLRDGGRHTQTGDRNVHPQGGAPDRSHHGHDRPRGGKKPLLRALQVDWLIRASLALPTPPSPLPVDSRPGSVLYIVTQSNVAATNPYSLKI